MFIKLRFHEESKQSADSVISLISLKEEPIIAQESPHYYFQATTDSPKEYDFYLPLNNINTETAERAIEMYKNHYKTTGGYLALASEYAPWANELVENMGIALHNAKLQANGSLSTSNLGLLNQPKSFKNENSEYKKLFGKTNIEEQRRVFGVGIAIG